MLSYQHGYHAGNFADVIKHIMLTRLLGYLTLKEKPLFYLETHAGKGFYDLKNKQAEKTKEYKQGIQLLWPQRQQLPPLFQNYLQIIEQCNPNPALRYYPGSPYIAMNLLRKQDRLYCCELHPKEFEALSQLQGTSNKRSIPGITTSRRTVTPKIHINQRDGITAMKALLPPPEKRGLIFIDPSFEMKEEYKEIPSALKQAYDRFSTGVYCLWYPLVTKQLTDRLNRNMSHLFPKNTLHLEFKQTPIPINGMYGCGLWIINPPFTLAEETRALVNVLKNYFNPDTACVTVEAN